jgi:glutamine synthetase
MGIDVISSHHEGSYSQHEIDLRHEDALTTADNIMTFKVIAKEIGQLNNIYASFMPKPLKGQNGSGLHIHQSLFRDDVNIFFNEKSEYYLSDEGRHFIAGLLRHSSEYFLITNQWINSYKRLVAGYESPTHATWSRKSQSAMIRIPQCRQDKPASMRVELRNPDPACNPYLAFSVMLAAGLKGIEEKYELQDPVESSNFKTEPEKFPPLPLQLHEALANFSKSVFMKETLGDFIHQNIIDNKIFEQEQFNKYITDYEIKTYLPRL